MTAPARTVIGRSWISSDATAGLATRRLWRSPADAYEQVLGFAGDDREALLIWHESRASPPNLAVVRLGDGGRTLLTSWPDPHPQATGMDKRLLSYDRGDGSPTLTGMLHLPPGYDLVRDGLLPAGLSGPTRSTTVTPRRLARSGARPSGSPG